MSKQSDLVGFSQGELTSAGRVGVNNGDMFISGTAHGIKFDEIDAGTMYIRPCNEAGTNENGQIDLGQGGNAFRDAYLTGGLYFSPHSYPANYLDDYEEGTFTPEISTNGSSGITYSTQSGTYIKIGALVHFACQFNVTGATSFGSGDVRFTGFPFNFDVTTTTRCEILWNSVNYDTSFTRLQIYPSNSTEVQILGARDNAGWNALGTGAFTIQVGSIITLNGTYRTSS